MRSRLVALSVIVSLLTVGLGGAAAERADAADPLPQTVPSVREALATVGGGYAWTVAGRIVVDGDGRLLADARTFATDLAGLTGGPTPEVVQGAPSTARTGDITMDLGSTDVELGEEGYALRIGPVLSISAGAATGAFWGSRTVLQLLRQSKTLPGYAVRDWPRYPVRAISVSLNAFPAGWFVNLLRDMSYVKLNELTVPALSGLTNDQIRDIQRVADQYHVKYVGWMSTVHYNGTVPLEHQLRVADRNNVVAKSPNVVDISKPAAVSWTTNQIVPHLDLHTTPQWHAGGDEYPTWWLRNDKVTSTNAPELYAAAKQRYPSETYPAAALYNEFFNGLYDVVRQRGKQMRMWNDAAIPTTAAKLNPGITIDHWLNYGPALDPAQLAANGHHLVNSNQDHLYFNEHQPGAKNATDTDLWTTFDPGVFNGGLRLPGGADDPHLDGIKLNTWHGVMKEPPAPLELDLLILNRPLAERAWAPAKPTSTITAARALFRAIGRAPGVVQTPAAGGTGDPYDPGKGSLPGSPALGYKGSQQVFFVSATGELRHRFRSPGTAVIDEKLTTTSPVTGRPLAYVAGDQLHVWARGTNGGLQHVWYEPSTGVWSNDDWATKAGVPLGSFGGDLAGFAYGNQQHVFVRGNDNRLRHFFWDGTSGRVVSDSWGGNIAGSPVAFAWGKTQQVFAVGSTGELRRWWWQPSDPGHIQHANLGGDFPADARPAGLGFHETRQDVVLRDTSGHLRLWSYDHRSGLTTWRDLTVETGVAVTGHPIEYAFGPESTAEPHIWARRAGDQHLIRLTLRRDHTVGVQDWSAATPGGAVPAVADPAGFNSGNTQQHVWVVEPTGRMRHWWWNSTDQQLRHDVW